MEKQHTHSSLKVALVYDKLMNEFGGAELVLQALKQAFPEAPVFTSIHNPTATSSWSAHWDIRTSFLQKFLWLWKKNHRFALPLQALAFESFSLDTFDVVISVSSEMARGVLTKPQQLHLCYLLTPPRFLYHQKSELSQAHWLLRVPGVRWCAQRILSHLRRWDQVAARRPDQYWCISEHVAQRLLEFHHRRADKVLYPPFQPLEPCNLPAPTQQYFLSVCRLVPYKKVSLSIHAALLTQRHLVVIGDGPELLRLQKQAGAAACSVHTVTEFAEKLKEQSQPQIWFVTKADPAEMSWWYTHATALLMPQEEDFGITGLEALSCGIPLITHERSGIAEVCSTTPAALLLKNHDVQELSALLLRCESTSWKGQDLIELAKGYSILLFTKKFVTAVIQATRLSTRER